MISMTKRLPETLAPNERRQGELIFETHWISPCGLIRLELFKEFRDLPRTEVEAFCDTLSHVTISYVNKYPPVVYERALNKLREPTPIEKELKRCLKRLS